MSSVFTMDGKCQELSDFEKFFVNEIKAVNSKPKMSSNGSEDGSNNGFWKRISGAFSPLLGWNSNGNVEPPPPNNEGPLPPNEMNAAAPNQPLNLLQPQPSVNAAANQAPAPKKRGRPRKNPSPPPVTGPKLLKESVVCKSHDTMARNVVKNSSLPTLESRLIPKAHWNPLITLCPCDCPYEAELLKLKDKVYKLKWPDTIFDVRETILEFWKILETSPFIRRDGDFFVGPNGSAYKPLVNFACYSNERATMLKVLNTWEKERKDGRNWTECIWQPGESTTPKEAAKDIRKEITTKDNLLGKPCAVVFASKINPAKHGKFEVIEEGRGEGFLWHLRRHAWNLVIKPDPLNPTEKKNVKVVKVDSLYPKLRLMDKQFQEEFHKPIQGYFVRSDVDSPIPNDGCLMESLIIALHVLMRGDDCRAERSAE